jgi:thiol-disulfide isomerase/thioredoxin
MRVQFFGTLALAALLFVSTPHSTRTRAADAPVETDNGELVVRVVDEKGVPCPGARFTLFAVDLETHRWTDMNRDTIADAAGSIRYDRLHSEYTEYVVRATTNDGQIGVRSCLFRHGVPRLTADLIVQRPVATTIHLHDQAGKPIAGTSLWVLTHIGVNGILRSVAPQTLAVFGTAPLTSDGAGNLTLPALPPGKIFAQFVHADYAPAGVEELRIPSAPAVDVTMLDGVKVNLDFRIPDNAPPVRGLRIRLTHDPVLHPSSLIGQLPELSANGKAQLTLAAGKYYSLRISHPDYIVTPDYYLPNERLELRPDVDNRFTFQLRPKVRIRGRVVDRSRGKPTVSCAVVGQTDAGSQVGPFAQFVAKWSDVDATETNDRGEYELKLPAGPARIRASREGTVAIPEHQEISVASDGSTVIPDIIVRPIPKVRGIVRDQKGQPVPRAIVRFRDSDLLSYQPVVSDAAGWFELAPDHMPVDLLTDKSKPLQTILAIYPYEPLGAKTQVSFSDVASCDNVTLQIAPQGYDFPVDGFPNERAALLQGLSAERKNAQALLARGGQTAPELDGELWLNTEKPKVRLSDFRGKFVLLQFWTTWCGPCHQDMPNLKLAYELYKDKGLVIIGIHDNSTPIDAIKQDVAAQKLPYPIVADHQDGRILSAYKPLGVNGYPTYFLVAPDGSIVRDPALSSTGLRTYTLEILRQQLMTHERAGR